MEDATSRAVLRRLVEQMRGDPAAVDGVVAAARAQSPPVAALPVAEVQRHIAGMIGAIAGAFLDRSGVGQYGLAADRLATDRALQGVPLVALLDGFQAGRSYILYRLIEDARAVDLPTDSLLDALHGGPPSRIGEAGLDPGRRYHCWLADVTDPSRVRQVETALTTGDG